MAPDLQWFKEARYGLFIQYGLYALLERGEWVMNREHIPIADYKKLADVFTADKLDFDVLLRRAKQDWGMRYAVMTCKHHDGFCLYDSQLTDFTSTKTRCGRDLVREFVDACRQHGLRIALYHTLNDWIHTPNAVDALERPRECYQPFIDYVHGQVREILTRYGKIDVLWYDGWWPFDGQGWQAEKLNAMARQLQPGIMVNGRCGIPGDFETPEGHVGMARAGRPWEVYMNLNESGGYHKGDHNWKSPKDVAEILRQCSAGQGNLMLNLAPRGDGSIPEPWERCVDKVGAWLRQNGEAIFTHERFVCSLRTADGARSDMTHHGRFTASDHAFYWHIRNWPGNPLRLTGVECRVTAVAELATGRQFSFRQEGNRLTVAGVPEEMDTDMPVVLRFQTQGPPRIYNCGGYNIPKVEHCRYDPVPSELLDIP
ncbi:MAG: alpha-L-fucosidase [Kiritimatiellae bacterium]|nr:alpha-L-fucosidase [Kiritimatiellia bacterium]